MMNIFFGADYYPDHWPESRLLTDAQLMQELGLNVVRMAEFAWAKLEPKEGEFHFDWLDKAIKILADHGIKSVLGTPSPTPPAWIIAQDPSILPVNSQGVSVAFGGRHHDCQSNTIYRNHIKRIVTAMAKHYQSNPNVIGWQTDNELGNSHQDLCHCPSCTLAFQLWLKNKYTTIANLNQKWGTWFWSQDYDHFQQIPTPKYNVTAHSPSLLLDWDRFCSDLIVDFQQIQVDILRKHCPQQFITHNFMGFADKVNYFDLAKSLDFVSHDQYPSASFYGGSTLDTPVHIAAKLDLMRGIKNQSFWIMEQQAGNAGWQTMSRTPRPGQLRMWATQSIAHGADCVVFFRWRTCTAGTEQYWHGILPHSGNPGRRYQELKGMISDLRPIMPRIQYTKPLCQVAILFSYDQNSAIKIQPQHPDLNYIEQIHQYYYAFYQKNIPVDFVHDQQDFASYKLIVAPLQYLMTPVLAQKFKEYVLKGGTLILTMRSGVKDEYNVCIDNVELPGLLKELAGIEILDYDCLCDLEVEVEEKGEYIGKATKWADIPTLITATKVATYKTEYYQGQAAISLHSFGQGEVYYVATEPDATLMNAFISKIEAKLKLTSLGNTPEGVEFVHRQSPDGKFIFAINHTEQSISLEIPPHWQPLLGNNVLPPYGTAIFLEIGYPQTKNVP